MLCAFLQATSAAAANNLFIDLKTDYLPGEDFHYVGVRVCRDDGTRCLDPVRRPVVTPEREAFLAGERVAELELADERRLYLLQLGLFDATGNTVARKLTRLDYRGGNQIVVFVVNKPIVDASKRANLAMDRDGDGGLSSGDLLRYEIVVRGASRFIDAPGPGGRLVAGSVTSSHGTVVLGNAAGDTAVEVTGLEAAGADGAFITFDVEVEAVIVNQGVAVLDRNIVNGAFATAVEPTDDPDTKADDDATVRAVGCSLGRCEEDLAACEAERDAAVAHLAAILADPDGDRVVAIMDLCLGTAAGAAVDDRGCSLHQFCERIDFGGPSPTACKRADWRGDEPATCQPRDCAASAGGCVAAPG